VRLGKRYSPELPKIVVMGGSESEANKKMNPKEL
jgi:hypothetical protein